MILVFAGRRVDAEGASPARFPLENVDRVRHEVDRVLADQQPAIVVGSAACGADLIVLDAARRLGLRRRVVLPFNHTEFRSRSVTDRPGDWGPLFDTVLSEAASAGDLVELTFDPEDETAYAQTNQEIFRQAEQMARGPKVPCSALVIWDMTSRGKGDVTEAFLKEAELRQWPVVRIDTSGAG
jgi:hypothetical protein